MRVQIENDPLYDTEVFPSDWRYSAAIVGLSKYLQFSQSYDPKIQYEASDESIKFNSKDITLKNYLAFVEHYYDDMLPHVKLERILHKTELTDNDRKDVKSLLKRTKYAHYEVVKGKEKRGITTLDKLFVQEEPDTKEICSFIQNNRQALTDGDFFTYYRNPPHWYFYGAYCNGTKFFSPSSEKDFCRIHGYYVDGAKKKNSRCYGMNPKAFTGFDDQLFDFIPFAFTELPNASQRYFINNSFSVKQLIQVNQNISNSIQREARELEAEGKRNQSMQQLFFQMLKRSANLLSYDMEIIKKDREKAYFETLYLRRSAIKILEKIEHVEYLSSFKKESKERKSKSKTSNNDWVNVFDLVVDGIVNNHTLDSLIETCIKYEQYYTAKQCISINVMIYQEDKQMGNTLTPEMSSAYACAMQVRSNIKKKISYNYENKIKTYQIKLSANLQNNDQKGFFDNLLSLSIYSGVNMTFVYDLYKDFEANRNLAYTFVNTLGKQEIKTSESGNN